MRLKIDRSKINWDTVIIGIVFFAFQLPFLPSTLEFRFLSVVTQGEVVKLNAGAFHPEVAFTTVDGKRESFAGSASVRTEIGDRVEVRYRLDDPRGAMLNNVFSIWGMHLYITVFSSLFIIGGLYGAKPSGRNRGDDD